MSLFVVICFLVENVWGLVVVVLGNSPTYSFVLPTYAKQAAKDMVAHSYDSPILDVRRRLSGRGSTVRHFLDIFANYSDSDDSDSETTFRWV